MRTQESMRIMTQLPQDNPIQDLIDLKKDLLLENFMKWEEEDRLIDAYNDNFSHYDNQEMDQPYRS